MNVIGFSAGCVGRDGNIDRMVKAILDKSGHEVEFVKLADLSYSGCKGCVQLCARPQVCMLADDAHRGYGPSVLAGRHNSLWQSPDLGADVRFGG